VEPGKELIRAVEIAQSVAAQSPLGVQATLASARLARTQGEVMALRRLLADLSSIMSSEDAAEGWNRSGNAGQGSSRGASGGFLS